MDDLNLSRAVIFISHSINAAVTVFHSPARRKKQQLRIYVEEFTSVVLIIDGIYVHIMGSLLLMSNHICVVLLIYCLITYNK